jgi:hypothetical protein
MDAERNAPIIAEAAHKILRTSVHSVFTSELEFAGYGTSRTFRGFRCIALRILAAYER